MKSFIYTTKQLKKGGAAGILSKEKLEGAIGQPKQTFGGQSLYKDLFEMTAVYLTSLVHNHPFMDGNKRIGSYAATTFLYRNDYKIAEFHQVELAVLACRYANRKTDKEGIANFFADRTALIDS
jgi:death-on-curing protein